MKTAESLLSPGKASPLELSLSLPAWLLCDCWAESLHAFQRAEGVHLRLKASIDVVCTVRVELGSRAVSLESSWTKKSLGSIRSGLYASPIYLSHHGTPFHKEQLAQHRWIACDPIDPLLKGLLKGHLHPGLQPVFTVHERSDLLKLTQEHAGMIAYIHKHPDLKNSGLIEVLPECSLIESPEYPLWFICSSLDWQTEMIQRLYASLKKALAL